MRFFEMLTLVIVLLEQERRVSYRALQREFDLDEAYLEDLKLERILSFPYGFPTHTRMRSAAQVTR